MDCADMMGIFDFEDTAPSYPNLETESLVFTGRWPIKFHHRCFCVFFVIGITATDILELSFNHRVSQLQDLVLELAEDAYITQKDVAHGRLILVQRDPG